MIDDVGDDSGELGRLYRDPRHYDLLAQMTAPADLGFYAARLGTSRGALLELGCGTGRLTLPLSARVDEAVGVDNSPPMLAYARSKALAAGSPARFVEADFTALELGRRFDWILLPYNALNHVAAADRIAALFDGVHAHLGEGGRFIVDTFQPDPAALGRPPSRTHILSYIDPDSGQRVAMHEENRYDAARQVNRVTWSYDIGGQATARTDVIEMRIFFPQELDALFAHHGFAIEAKLGDYGGAPFGSRSPKQLVIAARR